MWDLVESVRRDGEEGEDAGEHTFELDESDVPGKPTEQTAPFFDALSHVVDPELGINLVDLGLVYAVEFDDQVIRVALTATTPACPMQGVLLEDAERALRRVDDRDRRIEVSLVWEPAWRPDWMSDDARERLGGSSTTAKTPSADE